MCAALGCGGGGPAPAAPAEPAIDERTAEHDARGLVLEIYRTLGRGKTDSLFSLLDDRLIVFGPRPTDATASRADALGALGALVDPRAKRHAQLRSTGLTVVVSPGGHSAWAFDVIGIDGHLVAVTAVLSNTSDLWSVTALGLGALPASRQLRAESSRDAVVPPGTTSSAKVAPGAETVVDEFKKRLAAQDSWLADLTSDSEAVLAGPAAGQVARGKQAIQQLWKPRSKAALRAATAGEITALVTPDGQLAWLTAPVTRVGDGEEPLPMRIFAVYTKAGTGWRMTVLHEAIAISEPGSGAAFKKIVPPEPVKPEPARAEPAKAEPIKPADKPGGATKSKAKKKKPRPAPGADP